MYQKGKIVARSLIALLTVLISLSCAFIILPASARADDIPSLNIWRAHISTVGSVRITDKTHPELLNNVCISLPTQGILVQVQPANGGEFSSDDLFGIDNFPDSQCSASNFPTTAFSFTGQLSDLPPCSSDGKCRVYMTVNWS